MTRRWVTAVAVSVVLTWASPFAQESPEPAERPPQPQEKPSAPAPPRTTPPVREQLRVTVLLSRFTGDKKTASLPFVLAVTANGIRTNLRMGAEVPVAQTFFGSGDANAAQHRSYNYRPVGTTIDCSAQTVSSSPGVYEVVLKVEDSSIGVSEKAGVTKAIVEDVPAFRSFSTHFSTLLRDGQSMQFISATDPVTGEVTRVDVTLNVVGATPAR